MAAGTGTGLLGRAWRRLQLRRPLSDERGFTLIEMVVTVWILGAVIVALSGALFTSIRFSGLEQQKATAEVELRKAVEAVRAAPYVPCENVSTAPNYNAYQSAYASPTGSGIGWIIGMPAGWANYWDKPSDITNNYTDQLRTWQPLATVQSDTATANTNAPGTYPGSPCTSTSTPAYWDFGAQQVWILLAVPGGNGTINVSTTITKRNNAVDLGSNY